MKSSICSLLSLYLVLGAPAPMPKTKPPPPPERQLPSPGSYSHTWDEESFDVTITKKGDWLAVDCETGNRWEGVYTYDAPSRTLCVDEWGNHGNSHLRWACQLNVLGFGQTTGDCEVSIRIWPTSP